MNPNKTAVLITSGGLDSTVLAYAYKAKGFEVTMVGFDYGQRHKRELVSMQAVADALDVERHIVDLTGVTAFLGGSALTDDVEVPDGHYAETSMRQTVVPNRNMMMLGVAGALAVAEGADVLATGVHAGDHFIYPDCRPAFIGAMSTALSLGNEGFAAEDFHLEAPFIQMTKAGIVALGAELEVPFETTWSCYKGGTTHCGRCGTCVERIEAFTLAGVADPTQYADKDFAKEVTG